MSSGSVKKQRVAAKPVKPSAKGRQAGRSQLFTPKKSFLCNSGVDESDLEEPALPPPGPRQAARGSDIQKTDTAVARPRPRPRPVARAIKAKHQSEEILELTSSDEDGRNVDETSAAVDFGMQDVEDDPVSVSVRKVESPETLIRTWSSHDISKKRFLKDAAIFSEDDEFLVNVTPKKSRLNTRRVMLEDDYDGVSDTDNVRRRAGFAGDNENLSMSPLKLNNSSAMDGRDDVASDVDPFIEDDPFLEPIVVKRSKVDEKKKSTAALSAPEEMPSDDEGLHPEEKANIVKAMEESRRERQAEGVGTAGAGTKVHRTFKDVFPQPLTTPMMSNGPLLYEDTMKFRVPARSLTPLCKTLSLKSWSASTGSSEMALVQFHEWSVQCPNMDFDTACNAVRFVRYKNFINPSRISPLDVNILYTTHDRKRSILQCNYKTAICLTPVLSRDSHLVSPASSGLRNKYVSGHFHQQEWQHFEGFACMVFDKPTMIAQIQNEAISFVTMGPLKADRESSSSPSKLPRNPSILSSSVQKSAAGMQNKKLMADSVFKSVLDYSDDVPIEVFIVLH
ncbi:hypothetical protein BDZ97DRAFT_1920698 [Flammula alnicola]|nr:hypothetical protein BDZ97DRAFT_1920698 [Flammula alnicola]